MTTSIRDQIIDILAPHAAACQDPDCTWCDDAAKRADLILAAVADTLTGTGDDDPHISVRLGLALAAADPDRYPDGGGEAEQAAAMAVVRALADDILRPAPVPAERPAVADRYATLAGGEA